MSRLTRRTWALCTILALTFLSIKEARATQNLRRLSFELPVLELQALNLASAHTPVLAKSRASESTRPYADMIPTGSASPTRPSRTAEMSESNGGLQIRERHFPRALEVTIAALGGLAVIGGITLESVHGSCLNKEQECTSRIDSQKLGRASWIVGTQLLISSLVFLIIDEWPRRHSHNSPYVRPKTR